MPRRSARLSGAVRPVYSDHIESDDEPDNPPKPKRSRPRKVTHSADQKPQKAILFDCEDVVRVVCTFLGRADLRSMTTVNKVSYHAAIPSLYRHFDLIFSSCGCTSCPTHGKLAPFNAEYVRRFTTTVEYHPHSHQRHWDTHPDVPRLKTTIVNYDYTMFEDWRLKMRPLDKVGSPICSGIHSCSNCPERPPAERLVFRPAYSIFNVRMHVPKVIPTPIIDATETIYHINRLLPPFYQRAEGLPMPSQPATDSPRSLITIVVLPFMWDHGPITGQAPSWSNKASSTPSVDDALKGLVCRFFATHDIVIVGVENACPFAPASHWDKRGFREVITPHKQLDLYSRWRSKDDRSRMQKAITFKSFFDYLEDGEWGEELSIDLVSRWLDAYRGRERQERQAAKKKKKGRKRRRNSFIASDDEQNNGDAEYKP